jgi:branched-chain amino acid transport system permease protein
MVAAGTPGMGRVERSSARRAVRIGLIFGAVAVYLALVGLLPLIHERWIIVDVLTLGHAVLIALGLGAGIVVARGRVGRPGRAVLVLSLVAGALAGFLTALLVLAVETIGLRSIFIVPRPTVR